MGTVYSGSVTSYDLKSSTIQYLEILSDQKLYIMLDFSDSTGVPRMVMDLPALLQVITHPNTMWLTIVNPTGDNSYTARLLIRDKVTVSRDNETALAFLQGMMRLDAGASSETGA